jgi:hypothetical protein
MATKRERAGAKKLDLGVIRQAMMDNRVWSGMGVVRLFEGETSHYQIDTTAGVADIMVDVELAPNGERLVCRLSGAGGVWRIPAVGAEVVVIVPEGDFDADAIIVAELSHPTVGVPGLAPAVTIIMNDTVLVHSGDETEAKPLAFLSDVQTLRDEVAAMRLIFNAHAHILTLTSGTGTAAPPPTPQANPSTPVGTACLKGA